jgi:post-segregation antitoxin (ccd killing protein)
MVPLREKTVRKNLTIPARLAYQAERAGINFSQILSEALEKELQLQQRGLNRAPSIFFSASSMGDN